MSGHDQYRHMVAGYVLGALGAADRHALEGHLDECDECRREVADLAPIPGLLARVDPAEPERLSGTVVDRAVADARTTWESLARSRRRWRVAAIAAVIATVVALAPWQALDAGDPGGRVLAVESESVTGDVVVVERLWGTAVRLELAGLPQRDRYVAWVVTGDGGREQAAIWGPTPAGRALVDGASAISTSDVVAVVVTAGDGDEILASATVG